MRKAIVLVVAAFLALPALASAYRSPTEQESAGIAEAIQRYQEQLKPANILEAPGETNPNLDPR